MESHTVPAVAPPQVPSVLPQTISSSAETAPAEHDEDYYFDDEPVVFKVEHRLFKIHRYFLTRDSEFFRGLFSCPLPADGQTEGRTDAQAIVLHGVTEHEFKCLVRFFYDSMYRPSATSLRDWTALLSISTRFVFDRIRDLAILEISKQLLDPVDKIMLANKYNIPQWLPSAFTDLCKRPEPIRDSEAELLGLRTIVRIARARELARDKGFVTSTLRSYYPFDKLYSYNDKGISQVVDEVWPECVVSNSKHSDSANHSNSKSISSS